MPASVSAPKIKPSAKPKTKKPALHAITVEEAKRAFETFYKRKQQSTSTMLELARDKLKTKVDALHAKSEVKVKVKARLIVFPKTK